MSGHYKLELADGEPRRLVTAWLALAVTALAASTVFALALSIARTPFVGRLLPGVDLYRTALVLHVDLAVLILFLAHAALLWSAITVRASVYVQRAAFAFAATGTVAMVLSLFVARGPALMSNYVPLLDNPVFLAGIGGFALALLLAGVTALARGWPRLVASASDTDAALRWGIYLSILPMLLALASLGWMLFAFPRVAQQAYFEKVLWAPGHLMQFSYVLIMMVSWLILAGAGKVAVPVSPRAVRACFALTAAPVLLAPAIYLAFPAAGTDFRNAFTGLMAFASWPAAAWLGLHLLASALRTQRLSGAYDSARASLMLSVTLFIFGCIAGAAIASNNVMITGHYHGTVGAVALALMGIAMHLLPQLGFELPRSRFARWQPVVYGAGLLLMALGLVWSGVYNVQRKVPGSGLLSADPATLVSLSVVGAGGLIAFVGMLGCALPVLASLLGGRPRSHSVPNRIDNRPRALLLLLVSVVAGGLAITWLPRNGGSAAQPPLADPKLDPGAHADQRRKAEIELRFQQGVVMLHAKQYEYAMTAFQRVLELAPDMPEAHVNMGYALIGLKRFAAARDFFDSATTLRPDQVNAYWGLAVALEGLGDLHGALGAMRTYVHRTKPDDPFRRKAEAAIWEWEAQLAPKTRHAAATDAAADHGKPKAR